MLSVSNRIIRAFEDIVALILQDENFLIEGDDVALLVERVRASQEPLE